MSVWKSDETLLSICILDFSFKNDFVCEEISKKYVKNTPLRVVFSTLFSVFHLVMKHCISCLIYYFSYPTSASGIVLLLKTPTKYREFFPTLFVKAIDFSARF